MGVLVYHNGECNKSNSACSILQEKGIDITYKFYLHEPMTTGELKNLLKKLQLPATEILRKIDPLYIEQYEGKEMSEDEWIETIVANPILLQRPIVVNGDKAVIGRPPEKVLEIL
jgi:arsenate reductase